MTINYTRRTRKTSKIKMGTTLRPTRIRTLIQIRRMIRRKTMARSIPIKITPKIRVTTKKNQLAMIRRNRMTRIRMKARKRIQRKRIQRKMTRSRTRTVINNCSNLAT